MPQRVYNNVVGHRLLDNSRVAEDVTSISLPSFDFKSTTIDTSGMAMAVDMPDTTHLEAAEFSISHNNGIGCKYLDNPGKHSIEVRIARQRYDTAAGDIQHESVKFRLTGVLKGIDKGKVETGNPYGSTNKYSLLRYEEEIDGEVVTLIDATAGVLKVNGKDYVSEIENLLN